MTSVHEQQWARLAWFSRPRSAPILPLVEARSESDGDLVPEATIGRVEEMSISRKKDCKVSSFRAVHRTESLRISSGFAAQILKVGYGSFLSSKRKSELENSPQSFT